MFSISTTVGLILEINDSVASFWKWVSSNEYKNGFFECSSLTKRMLFPYPSLVRVMGKFEYQIQSGLGFSRTNILIFTLVTCHLAVYTPEKYSTRYRTRFYESSPYKPIYISVMHLFKNIINFDNLLLVRLKCLIPPPPDFGRVEVRDLASQ